MHRLTSFRGIKSPYSRRILAAVLNKDPLAIYSSTPVRLRRLVLGLSERQLRRAPAKGKWSIVQIVSHLCDAELAMSFRIRMAVAQPGSKLQAYDQEKWAVRLRYGKSDCREKLHLFSALRKANVSLLKSLKPAEWKRFGIHEERGKETVDRMIQMLAGHDINHLEQVERMRKSF
jgi:hypothetical protein